ncbi:MAG: methyltransferase domain-containing protein [Spirochaetia bacterium]
MKEPLTAIFDRLAEDYDSWYQTPLGARSDALEKEAVFSLAEARPGEHALDVSCGTGNYALALAGRGVRVVAIDASEKMLQIAQSKAAREGLSIDFRRGTAEDMPFADDSFDLVTAVLLLEFAPSPQKVLAEMLRVLTPAGRLVVGVLGNHSLWAAARRAKRLFVPSIWSGATFFSPRTMTDLLREAGAHSFRWKNAIYFPPLKNGWLLDRFQVLEGIGQKAFPGLGAFFAVRVEK